MRSPDGEQHYPFFTEEDTVYQTLDSLFKDPSVMREDVHMKIYKRVKRQKYSTNWGERSSKLT